MSKFIRPSTRKIQHLTIFGTAAAPSRSVGTRLGDLQNIGKIIGTRVDRKEVKWRTHGQCVFGHSVKSQHSPHERLNSTSHECGLRGLGLVTQDVLHELLNFVRRTRLARSLRLQSHHDGRMRWTIRTLSFLYWFPRTLCLYGFWNGSATVPGRLARTSCRNTSSQTRTCGVWRCSAWIFLQQNSQEFGRSMMENTERGVSKSDPGLGIVDTACLVCVAPTIGRTTNIWWWILV